MKKALLALLVVFALCVGAMIGLIVLVNPNTFKPVIARQVKEATGRDLVLAGDLSWSFFPRLGIAAGRAHLANPPDFDGPPMFAMDGARLAVEVMPLFGRRLAVSEIALSGVAVHLITLEDGRSNLDGLGGPAAPGGPGGPGGPNGPGATSQTGAGPAAAQPVPAAQSPMTDWQVELAGVVVQDASLRIDDRRAQRTTEVRDVNLTLSRFTPGEWVDLALNAQAESANVRSLFTLAMRANLAPDFSRLELQGIAAEMQAQGPDIPGGTKKAVLQGDAELDLKNKDVVVRPLAASVDDLAMTGEISASYAETPRITADFSAQTLDLNPLLTQMRALNEARRSSGGAEAAGPAAPSAATGGAGEPSAEEPRPDAAPGDPSRAEPDLSALRSLNARLNLRVDKLLADPLSLTGTRAAMRLEEGTLSLDEFATSAYSGAIAATALLESATSPAAFAVTLKASEIQAQEALSALANTSILSGTATVGADLRGRGLSRHALKNAIQGTATVLFADGAIWGVNIPLELRKIRALLRGETIDASEAVQKTDFSSLAATFQINDGLVKTDDLALASPLLRVNGRGVVELPSETMDMLLDVGVVGTLEGQQGKEWEDLAGLRVPLRVSGPLAGPSFAVDLDAVLRQRAGQEAEKLKGKAREKIDEELRKQLGDDASEGVGGLLKRLF